jgi:hypothetical protein
MLFSVRFSKVFDALKAKTLANNFALLLYNPAVNYWSKNRCFFLFKWRGFWKHGQVEHYFTFVIARIAKRLNLDFTHIIIQWKLLNVITLGQRGTDNNNQMMPISKWTSHQSVIWG